MFYLLTATFEDTLCLGKALTTIEQGTSSLQFHSTDPGLGSPQCLFW